MSAAVRLTTNGAGSSSDRSGCAIAARGLTRDFGDFRAVDHVDFEVQQGEIFGLLGANGAGKTTVIKMLTGLLLPSSGEGEVAGVDMRRAGRAIKQRIGYMSQAFSLYHDLSVIENLRLYARIYGLRGDHRRHRIQKVIERTGLEGCSPRLAGDLPMGLRQRLAIACALVHQPRVLFLDEPTSGVDPVGRRRFWDILVRLAREEHVAILVTTHHMAEAEHCDRLALMAEGRIIADASPQAMKRALMRDAGTILEVSTDRPLAAFDALVEANFEGAALFGPHIHLLAQRPDEKGQQIRSLLAAKEIQVTGLASHEPTLEDVFIYRILALERAQGPR